MTLAFVGITQLEKYLKWKYVSLSEDRVAGSSYRSGEFELGFLGQNHLLMILRARVITLGSPAFSSTARRKDMLIVDRLTKQFGGIKALNAVSFKVNSGEIVGLIGPNGSGKTTMFEVISGFCRPTKGKVLFRGERIDHLKPHQILRRGIARSFQAREFMGSFAAREYILLASLSHLLMSQAGKWTEEVLELVGLKSRADVLLPDLTLPDQKALEFGRVVATQAEMILLDEVMAGLTPVGIEPIVQLIRRLRENGKTFVVVEHRMEIVTHLCDRIIVLNFGRKIAEGTPAEVIKNNNVVEAYLGGEMALA